MTWLLPGLAAVGAVLLAAPWPTRVADRSPPVPPDRIRPASPARGLRRAAPAVLAGVGGWLFVGGAAGPVAGVVVGAVAWWFLLRAEPAGVRREREQVRRDLPALVGLLAAALRSGASPAGAVRTVCDALPGAAAERLLPVAGRLDIGLDPARVWAALATDPDLAVLGRALARSHETGASVVASVERLADDLERTLRADTEERARAVGVRAALPLGLCLLPAFLLLGIVPLVAGLVAGLQL